MSREHERVGHQVAQRRVEVAVDRLRRDVPPREHAGDQFILSADLTNGEGAHLPRPVESRPPRPAEGGEFDVEKITLGNSRCRPGRRPCDSLERAMVEPAAQRGRARSLRPARRPQETFEGSGFRAVPPAKGETRGRGGGQDAPIVSERDEGAGASVPVKAPASS